MSSTKKIYIGCSLRHATVEFRQDVEKLKNTLRSKYEIMDFVGLVDNGFDKVYKWDIENCVAKCDAFVAICDHPSIGLGYELACAIREFKKPVLAVAHKNAKLSGLIQGIHHKNFTLQRYQNFHKDVPLIVETWLHTFYAASR